MDNLHYGGQKVEGKTLELLNGKRRSKSRKSDLLTAL